MAIILRNKLYALVFTTLFLFAIIVFMPRIDFPTYSYLNFHSIIELAAVFLSFMIFILGWTQYNQKDQGKSIIFGIMFLSVGLLDLAHMFSYSGMPDFITPNSPNKSTTFWLSARIMTAAAFLSHFYLPERSLRTPYSKYLALGGSMAVTAAVYGIVLFRGDWIPLTYDSQGLTPFKIGTEYAIMATLIFTAIAIFVKSGRSGTQSSLLAFALGIMALSELCFTMYVSVYDNYNALGHIYKMISYLAAFIAIYWNSIHHPFTLLKRSEAELRRSETELRQARDWLSTGLNVMLHPVVITDAAGRVTFLNDAARQLMQVTDADAMNRPIADLMPTEDEHPVDRAIRLLEGSGRMAEIQSASRIGEPYTIEYSAAPIFEDRQLAGVAFVFSDISVRKEAEAKQKLSYIIFENIAEGIMITDEVQRILYTNPSFTAITGYEEREAAGQTPRLLRSGWHKSDFYQQMWNVIRQEGSWQGEIWNKRKDGDMYLESITITTVRNESGKIVNYIGVLKDITVQKQLEAKLQHQAFHDALTGLPNRILLQERMAQAFRYAEEHRRCAAVMFVNVDRFKRINDSFGHASGDLLLKSIAERISAELRASDTLCRLGGDEFVILLPDLRHRDDSARFAAKIIEKLKQSFYIENQELFLTASIGISQYPEDGMTGEALIQNANKAMYRAKESGRNNYQSYSPLMMKKHRSLSLETDLQKALLQEQFVVHYQPLVNADTGLVTGAEALVRWNHPQLGLVPPGQFIPIAEDSGLIIDIDKWMIRNACKQLKRWQEERLPHVSVSVNISTLQFHQSDFVAFLADALAENRLEPGSLSLELTESTVMSHSDIAFRTLDQLRQMGIPISIDDFGTGYSSLNYLRKMPIQTVKIDQSFIRELTVNREDRTIVQAIISLSRNLNLNVVAEGVETEEQLQFLRENQCTNIQGFYFSKPLPEQPFRKYVLERAGLPQ